MPWRRTKHSVPSRVIRRVHTRYLRHLAKHPPDSWWYSRWWRSKLRRIRFVYRTLWIAATTRPVLRNLTLTAAIILAAGLAAAAVAFAGALAHALLIEERPAAYAPEDLAIIALLRLSLGAVISALGIVLVGSADPMRLENRSRSRFCRRRENETSRTQILRWLVLGWLGAMTIGAWVSVLPLQHFWAGYLAAVALFAVCAWLIFWCSLRIPQISSPTNGNASSPNIPIGCLVIALAYMSLVVGGMALAASIHSQGLNYYLAWLRPLSWIAEWFISIGRGTMAPCIPLGISIAGVMVVALGVRRSAKSFAHLRRVLTRNEPRSDQPTAGTATRESPDSDTLRSIVRAELQRHPTTWRAWIWPRWIADGGGIVATAGIGLFLFQGVMLGCIALLRRVGFDELAEDPESELLKRLLLLSVFASVIFIEAVGIVRQDASALLRFRFRCITAVQLWNEIQWFGLCRMPTSFLLGAFSCVVPAIAYPRDFGLIAFVFAASLLTNVALKSVVVARVVSGESARQIVPEPWLSVIYCLGLIAFGGMILVAVIATAALTPPLGAAPAIAISILATQAFSGALVLFSIWLWRFANRPPAHV